MKKIKLLLAIFAFGTMGVTGYHAYDSMAMNEHEKLMLTNVEALACNGRTCIECADATVYNLGYVEAWTIYTANVKLSVGATVNLGGKDYELSVGVGVDGTLQYPTCDLDKNKINICKKTHVDKGLKYP